MAYAISFRFSFSIFTSVFYIKKNPLGSFYTLISLAVLNVFSSFNFQTMV